MSLEQNYTAILGQLGEDVGREGLLDTPKRAAKAMQYLCRGYQQSLEEVTNGALFSSDNSEMVLVKNIELYSLCEHHLLPFIGKAHVAYIPNGKVLGLSKVARIVDMYARRLQIQENLSRQIAEAIQQVTESTFFKRYGTLNEQVAPILFLASDEAGYITGTVLPVAGGDLG